MKFGHGKWLVGSVYYARKDDIPLAIIIPAVIVPMLLFIAVSVYCYRFDSHTSSLVFLLSAPSVLLMMRLIGWRRQEEESAGGARVREGEAPAGEPGGECSRSLQEGVHRYGSHQEGSHSSECVEEREEVLIFVLCPSDLMIEMEDHTSDLSEARIPFLDYKTYTDRNFFLPSKDGANDAMITRKLQIPEARRAIVAQALNQFSNLLNSKTFLINVSLKLLVPKTLSL